MRSPQFRSIGKVFVALKLFRAMRVGAWCAALLFALAVAPPARAQATILFQEPPVPGFSNSYPWFNDFPQYQGDQSLQWFMTNHPDIAGAVQPSHDLRRAHEAQSQPRQEQADLRHGQRSARQQAENGERRTE